MFNIKFLKNDSSTQAEHKDRYLVDPEGICYGKIVLGSFTEKFESAIGFWNSHQYQEHWLDAVSRLLEGAEKTALITSIHDPATANFIVWWPLYRVAENVFVQNQTLFLNTLSKPFELAKLDEFVRPRRTFNEEGTKISEWAVLSAEMSEFKTRMQCNMQR